MTMEGWVPTLQAASQAGRPFLVWMKRSEIRVTLADTAAPAAFSCPVVAIRHAAILPVVEISLTTAGRPILIDDR
jgi:hypothetical protein